MRNFSARAMALASLVLLSACAGSPAFAAEAVLTAPATAVILPYGDWIVGAGQTVTAVLLPILIGGIMWALRTYVPVLGLFVSQSLVERLVRNVTDYALNAIAGAMKGKELDVPTGSAVITKATQHAVDQAPGWLLKMAGGPTGVAEKVFRALHLDDKATAANTLAPALVAVPAAKG